MSKEAMKLALEALGEILESFEKDGKFCKSSLIRNELFDRLEATFDKCKAISEAKKQEQGEPVAWIVHDRVAPDRLTFVEVKQSLQTEVTPLYTTPQQRTWVRLDWSDLPDEWVGKTAFMEGAKWAERKLKEKNT